jgi:hypothetical protein
MGAKSSPARSQEARANAKADRRSGGPAGAPCRAHRQGLPKVWAEICSQPNQSAISGSFFGTKYWKCAESDDGNPKKSMILHRMVPSDSAKSVLIDLSLPPLPNSAFWRPFRTQEVRPAAAVHAPSFVSAPPALAPRLSANNLDDSAKEAVRKDFKGPSGNLCL